MPEKAPTWTGQCVHAQQGCPYVESGANTCGAEKRLLLYGRHLRGLAGQETAQMPMEGELLRVVADAADGVGGNAFIFREENLLSIDTV